MEWECDQLKQKRAEALQRAQDRANEVAGYNTMLQREERFSKLCSEAYDGAPKRAKITILILLAVIVALSVKRGDTISLWLVTVAKLYWKLTTSSFAWTIHLPWTWYWKLIPLAVLVAVQWYLMKLIVTAVYAYITEDSFTSCWAWTPLPVVYR